MPVYKGMIIFEPLSAYEARQHGTAKQKRADFTAAKPPVVDQPVTTASLNAPLEFDDGWDETILAYVRSQSGESQKIVSLVSVLRKCVLHRNSRHKNEIKRHILHRITALIRSRRLLRVNRQFVIATEHNCH